jgi:DNA-binding MarR family transcriptional regulator
MNKGYSMKTDFINNIQFFIPTDKLKKLLLLEQIEKNSDVTQARLAEYIHSAPSMVNNYIKVLEKDGLLIKKKNSKRNVEYLITKEGLGKKNYLLVTFMNELIELYNLTKENIELFIKKMEVQGIRSVVFYGAGETAKVIIKVLKDMPDINVKLLFLVDDNKAKQGKSFEGYKVYNPKKIEKQNIDAVVITSCVYGNEIKTNLVKIQYPRENIIDIFV